MKLRHLAILFAAIALSACSKEALDLRFKPASAYMDDEYAFAIVQAPGAWEVSSDASWLTVVNGEGVGNREDVILSFSANLTGVSRSANITLKGESSSITKKFTQYGTAKENGGGIIAGLEFFWYKNTPSTQRWLELPATEKSTDVITHFFNYKGNTMRNYTYDWSRTHNVSYWVAYPLGGAWSDNNRVGRTEAWGADPVLGEDGTLPTKPSDEHPLGGNYCSGWTRGHQIPSADRQCSEIANLQTFYGTNMTPQDYDFNTQIWLSAETQVRAWASRSDTLYVVTGCVVNSDGRKLSEPYGHKVTVPAAYYKALLSYRKSGGYQMCAMYLNHFGNYSDYSITSHLISVDELEKLTGIDFFVNLPYALMEAAGDGDLAKAKKKADELEAATPGSWWK